MAAITKSIRVVSFNANEQAAVDSLLDDLLYDGDWEPGDPPPLRRLTSGGDRERWSLTHVPLMAQGNVMAAVQLADFFTRREADAEFIVFYGCAGALTPEDARSVFLVHSATYLALGSVDPPVDRDTDEEVVRLNNKWLCHLDPPADVAPLTPAIFPLCTGHGTIDVPQLTGLPVARVAATEKVLRVAPSAVPIPTGEYAAGRVYPKSPWSYAAALALIQDTSQFPVIVEMESYGIGLLANALGLQDSVVVLRVTTDTLEDHADSDMDQADLLMEGRDVLGSLLLHLFDTSVAPTVP
jgi:hypothetical protein